MAAPDIVDRLLRSLEDKRRKMALDMISGSPNYDKYLEVRGRCLELEEVIAHVRHVFQGAEEE